jgi:hypothetical protein
VISSYHHSYSVWPMLPSRCRSPINLHWCTKHGHLIYFSQCTYSVDPTYGLAQKVPRGKTRHWGKGWRSPFCIDLGSWWACPSEIALCAPNPHEIATRWVLSLDAHSQLPNMPLSKKLHPIFYFGTWTWN